MSQEGIYTLLQLTDLPQTGDGAINALFDEHIAHVEERIQELAQLKRHLHILHQRCQDEPAVDGCGIVMDSRRWKPSKSSSVIPTWANRIKESHDGQ